MNHSVLKYLLTPLILFISVANIWASSVDDASRNVFTLTSYNKDGTIHATSHGVFVGNNGEAIAMWNVLKGADRAIVIDAKGKQYDVDAMLGVSENYDLCKFQVKGYKGSALQMAVSDVPASKVYIVNYSLKKPDIKSVAPERSEKFMTSYNYYVFHDEDVSGTQLGCPIVNGSGELLGIMQRPETGGQAYSADARLTNSFKLNGFSINNPSMRATAIRTAFPDDEEQAALMLMLAASLNDNAKYDAYINDFINKFPSSNSGYKARATVFVNQGKLADADNMLKTELKEAEKKDVANSDFAAMMYQACVYRIDTTFTEWTLDKALSLAKKADDINPSPSYKHQEAQILYAQGKYQDALALFTSLQQTELGKNGEVYYEAAQSKAQLKAPEKEIMALLDKAVNAQSGPASAPFVLARGRQYDNDGNYRKAFFDYLKYDSLMNFNASADFYFTKFQCEKKIRNYQMALDDIAHAIVLNRTEPVYYAEMASLQLMVNMPKDAIRTCNLALQLTDKMADLYIIRGIALCETKQKSQGLADLNKAKELGDARADGLIAKYEK